MFTLLHLQSERGGDTIEEKKSSCRDGGSMSHGGGNPATKGSGTGGVRRAADHLVYTDREQLRYDEERKG